MTSHNSYPQLVPSLLFIILYYRPLLGEKTERNRTNKRTEQNREEGVQDNNTREIAKEK